MKKTVFILLLFVFVSNVFAQDAQYVYGPITGVTLDDMFAVANKTFANNSLKTEKFVYSKGVIESSAYDFVVLINEYRCNIEIKNTDAGVYISFVNLKVKSEGRYQDAAMVLGKKPKKLIAAIGKEFENIAGDASAINDAKTLFYNDPATHHLFFAKATDLAVDRWYEKYLKDKSFTWLMEFRDIDKNETELHTDYKYILTGRYYKGSSLVGSEGIYVRLFTNDDQHTMTDKGEKIDISGKCVGFKESGLGYYLIDFVQE